MQQVKILGYYILIIILCLLAARVVFANQDCHTGQNLLSQIVKDANDLEPLVKDDECAEEYFVETQGFFQGWRARTGRLQGYADEASMYIGTPELCLNYKEYAEYLSSRYNALVGDYFETCFDWVPN